MIHGIKNKIRKLKDGRKKEIQKSKSDKNKIEKLSYRISNYKKKIKQIKSTKKKR